MRMKQRARRGYTLAELEEVWDRWKRGESLKSIGRVFGKHPVYHQGTHRATTPFMVRSAKRSLEAENRYDPSPGCWVAHHRR